MLDEALYLRTYHSVLLSSLCVKEFGEVYTPLILVEEMLDSLPPSVWSDPSLRWLEPAAGLAPFIFCAYRRLMKGLRHEFPNDEERNHHVLSMFTLQEIQEKNVQSLRGLFPNVLVLSGDYLASDLPSKYDVIVGNPPYQRNGSSNTGNTIWDKFVKKILTADLAEGGFLVFVHPPMWRKPSSKHSKNAGLFSLLSFQNQIRKLVMCDAKEGKRVFGCQTRFDWYCLEKKETNESTSVRTVTGKEETVDLREWDWLPSDNLELVRSLLAKDGDEMCPVIYDRSAYATDKAWTVKEQSKSHPFPVIRTVKKDCETFLYSSLNDRGHYGLPKVVFGDGGSIQRVVVDIDGSFGLSEHAIGIGVRDPSEAEKVRETLLSQRFALVLASCVWSARQIDWRLFASFRREWYS